jgi:hypothetical protein
MQIMSISLRLLCGLALCGALIGCKKPEEAYDGPDRIPVSGKVTLDGTALANGTITFLPKDEGIRPFGGQIENGEYNIPEQKGGNAGAYFVQITSKKPTGKQRQDEDTGQMVDIVEEAIPKKYNTESTEEVKLSDDNNVFNYDLTSK